MKKLLIFIAFVLVFTASLLAQSEVATSTSTNDTVIHSLSWFEKLLVTSPFIMTGIVSFILMVVFKGLEFSVASAMTEFKRKSNAESSVSQPNGETIPKDPKSSSSRLIAFLSSLCILCIAICLVSFYMYEYLMTGSQPSLDTITNTLYALGLGFLPYGVNKISDAIK
jgi:hypothetical protein